MKRAWLAAAAAAALVAAPAHADDDRVKAGVDAWARGDYATAVEAWRSPAEAGDPDAEFNLAQAYKLGRGVPVDLDQAEKWYRLAAQQNHPQAQDNYGLALFQNGKHADALPWLQRSAQRGEPRAQFVLGTMYFNGDGVTKDWVRAYAWIVRSSASGLPQATQTLAQMDRYITVTDRQEGLALAKRYEAQANATQAAPEVAGGSRPIPPASAVAQADLPPSSVYRAPDAAPPPPPRPAPAAQPARAAPRPAPAAQPARAAPRPAPVATAPRIAGGWKVQLGAFGDPANARKLWARVGGRFGGRAPEYARAGALTKLLVGPYAGKADANRACAGISPCIPVAP